MLLMIEKHYLNPAKSVDTRYPAKYLLFMGI